MSKNSLQSVAACLLAMAAGCEAWTLTLPQFTVPTSFSIHQGSGRVYISGKMGAIHMAASTAATSVSSVKTLINVYTKGDHGLTSVAAIGNYLYATYMTRLDAFGMPCSEDENDPNTPVGRPASNVTGCPTRGRLVRFPIAVDGTLGSEEVLLPNGGSDPAPGATAGAWCAQFDKGSVNYVAAAPNAASHALAPGTTTAPTWTDLLVSAGAGSNVDFPTVADRGQFGATPNVCGTGSVTAPFNALQGTFRAMDPASLNGKVVQLGGSGPGALTTTTMAMGMNNPWRFAWATHTLAAAGAGPTVEASIRNAVTGNGALYTIDTGLTDNEEVNLIPTAGATAAVNFGFPCKSGVFDDATYMPVCAGVNGWGSAGALPTFAPPLFNFSHPSAPAVFSALAVHPVTGRVWLGDYVNSRFASFDPASTAWSRDYRVEFQGVPGSPTGAFPVHLAWIVPPGSRNIRDGAMHYLDIVTGKIAPVPNQPSYPSGAPAGAQVSLLAAMAAAAVLVGTSFLRE